MYWPRTRRHCAKAFIPHQLMGFGFKGVGYIIDAMKTRSFTLTEIEIAALKQAEQQTKRPSELRRGRGLVGIQLIEHALNFQREAWQQRATLQRIFERQRLYRLIWCVDLDPFFDRVDQPHDCPNG